MPSMVYPVAFYILYIFALFLTLAVVRVRGVKRGQIQLEYFSTYAGQRPPEWMVILGRHYDNQFQVPVLFLLTCVAALNLPAGEDATFLALSWGFVISRLLHTAVHLGSNNVVHRLAAYAIGWLLLIAQWAQLVLMS